MDNAQIKTWNTVSLLSIARCALIQQKCIVSYASEMRDDSRRLRKKTFFRIIELKIYNGINFCNSLQNSVSDSNNLEDVLIKRLNSKCTQRDVSSCLILKLVTYMNRMLKKAAIQIGDDLEITQNR